MSVIKAELNYINALLETNYRNIVKARKAYFQYLESELD